MTEFTLQGVRCRVLPEPEARRSDFCSGSGPGLGGSTQRVVGHLQLEKARYVILAPSPEETARRGPSAPVGLLTRRELEIAFKIAEGYANKEIAHQLKLSEWTVSSYLRRIYSKFGVHSRTAMVVRLLEGVGPHRGE